MPEMSQSDANPSTVSLVVDLDETLIHGDSLWESFFSLVKDDLGGFLAAAFAVRGGRAALKHAVATRLTPRFEEFCFNEDVVAFVKRESESRPIILATAANERLAHVVADGLGCISHIIASGKENRKSGAKLSAVKDYLSESGMSAKFDYIGDHVADRPLWTEARNCYVVASSDAAALKLTKGKRVAKRFPSAAFRFNDIIQVSRPMVWPWLLLVFVPSLGSDGAPTHANLASAAIALLCLFLMASAVFLWSDILDIFDDRQSGRKRGRLFARGALNIPLGVMSALVLSTISLITAILYLPSTSVLILFAILVAGGAFSLLPAKHRGWSSRVNSGAFAATILLFGATVTGVSPYSLSVILPAMAFAILGAATRFTRVRD